VGTLLLGALVALAFHGVRHLGYIWDDDNYVLNNLVLRSTEGLRRIWLEPRSLPQYYPLVHTTFWLEYRAWGLQPLGYHVVNVVLHTLAALVLWRLLALLRVPGAWLGAALFAVHPVQVETVAWVTERKNVLSALFAFGSVYLYWRFVTRRGQAGRSHWHDWLWYGGSLLAFLAALLSKTVTCAVPGVLFLLLWWRRPAALEELRGGSMGARTTDWSRWLPLAPFFLLGVPLALTTVWLERQHVGAMGPEWDFTWLQRGLIAGRVVWFYLGKLVWPDPLMFIYPRWAIDATQHWQFLYPAGVLALAGGCWVLRRRLGGGLLAGVLIFVGTLTPALGFFNVYPMRYSFVADHFQYHASAAALAVLAAILTTCLDRLTGPQRRLPRVLAYLVPGALLLVLCGLTARYLPVFRDAETLWRDVRAKNPQAWIAHNNLGQLLLQRGEYAAAKACFEQAIALKADHANAHTNLAVCLEHLGDLATARRHYERGLALDNRNPLIMNEIGNFFARQGDLAKAEQLYRQALLYRPRAPALLVNLGNVLAEQRQPAAALEYYRQALALDPLDTTARYNLGLAARAAGYHAEAVAAFRQVMERQPGHGDAVAELAWLLATSADDTVRAPTAALELAQRLLAALPEVPPRILALLAAAQAASGAYDEAIATAERALAAAGSAPPPGLAEQLAAYRARQPWRELPPPTTMDSAPIRP
jgi:tetratricopeptide (TPR) repeat protein